MLVETAQAAGWELPSSQTAVLSPFPVPLLVSHSPSPWLPCCFPLLFYLSHFLSSLRCLYTLSYPLLSQSHNGQQKHPPSKSRTWWRSWELYRLAWVLGHWACFLNLNSVHFISWGSVPSPLLLCRFWGNLLSWAPYWCWVAVKRPNYCLLIAAFT